MSVPVNKRRKADGEYALKARKLASKIYEISNNNSKRYDTRLNNPMSLESAKILKHAINAYNVNDVAHNKKDYKYRKKQLKKSLRHMDMLESYLFIWWDQQERKLSSRPDSKAKEDAIRKRDNLYDQLGDMIVDYRDSVKSRIDKDRRSYKSNRSKRKKTRIQKINTDQQQIQ